MKLVACSLASCPVLARSITILLMLSLGFPVLRAQAPDTAWTRRYGGPATDRPEDGTPVPGGGCVVTGMYTAGSQWDCYVIRFLPTGDTAWTRRYGGSYGDYGRDILPAPGGGFFLLGYSQSVQYGDYFTTLRKIDSLGNSLWYKVTGKVENPWGFCVTPDTGFGIAAMYESGSGTLSAITVIRAASNGDTLWSRRFDGALEEGGKAIVATPDTGFLVLANTKSFGAGNQDIMLLRVNSRGDTLWTRTYGDPLFQQGMKIELTSDGNYVIVGSSSVSSRSSQVYLIKIRPDGSTVWEKTIGGTVAEAGWSIAETPDGGFIIGGTKDMGVSKGIDMYLLRVNSSGDSLWSTTVGGTGYDAAYFVHPFLDGPILLVGDDRAAFDVLVAKFKGGAVGVEETVGPFPEQAVLHQNYPNPFNPSTTISYDLPQRSYVLLEVFDALGQRVATLLRGEQEAGSHAVKFEAHTISTGVYFCRLTAGDCAMTRRLLLLR